MIPPNVEAAAAGAAGGSAARALIPASTLRKSRVPLGVAKRGFRWAMRGLSWGLFAIRARRKGRPLVIPWASCC